MQSRERLCIRSDRPSEGRLKKDTSNRKFQRSTQRANAREDSRRNSRSAGSRGKIALRGGASEVEAGLTLVRRARALQPDQEHGSSRKAIKLLVRLRRLAVAINPEERVRIGSAGSRCPAVAKENYHVNGTQTTGGKKGSNAQRASS